MAGNLNSSLSYLITTVNYYQTRIDQNVPMCSDCIQCDEDKSGPNFKYFSGRTRRNSGIPSSIYRPPQTVYNMTHCYWYGDLSS